ncbi:MAG: FtsH protease activity modulator HflK [Lachnospiraceae bacterium]|nr:FtsH protease activity modulator HflK [Lachnospiraceae bacterium]
MNVNDSKALMRIVKIVAVVVVVAIFGFNCYYTIGEQEQAVVTTFGRPEAVSEPGLHFKIPFIQKITKVDTTIKGLTIGYDAKTEWPIEEESLMITSDYNFVNVDFYLEYKVSDPIKALYASKNPVAILKNMAQGCIRSVIGSYDVDSVITTGKSEIQSKIKTGLMEQLELRDIGIQLVNISIQDAEPPTEAVIEAFKAVETAKQGKETAINNAKKYRSEQLPQAEAQVDQILKTAEAEKQARINEAEGQAARFNALYEEYIKYPLITKQRMFFETMQELLPDMEVIIDNGSGSVQKILPLDSFTE